MQLKTKFILFIGLIVSLSYGVTFYRTASFQEELVVEQATMQAKMLFHQIRLTRQWIADHNGLFLVKEPGVEANPFLENSEIQDQQGNWLVRRNPAMVTRELSLYAAKEGMGQFNVTSLKPVNPLNAPDEFERRTLHEFENGKPEAVEIEKISGSYRLRYMAPLPVDERCLMCHGKQGYQIGDIRGGMNVTIPMDWAYAEIRSNNRLLLNIALATIVLVSVSIFFLFNKLVGQRLNRLATAMDRYPEHPFEHDPKQSHQADEIGILDHHFHDLCERLETSQQELDKTREQVFQNEKLAALGRMVAGISHEINNPLGGMQNCLQILKKNPDKPEMLARYLTLLSQGVDRIKNTVQQLLNIGRREPLEIRKEDIDRILRDCVELSCMGHRNITVTFDLKVGREITTGIEALKQVILNLAGNAVQAIGPGPGEVKVSSRLRNHTLQIRISDNGPGIPAANLDKIFEPFFTTKEVGDGTGLGLSVSHSLVKQLDGDLRASNNPGGGACFMIDIPPLQSIRGKPMKERILVVEDDDIMRITVSDHLGSFAWQVDEATTGKEALELVRKNDYDLVVSDIRMPGMDGEQLLTSVKQMSPATEVIMMTAHGSTDHAVTCLKKGAADYILKPFDLDDLTCRIERIIGIRKIKARCASLESGAGRRHPLIGTSVAMQQVLGLISQVAPTDATVLIQGESGTGKELVAAAIHHESQRVNKPYIRVNCAAIPAGLLESELFGHEKGAFTGADRTQEGKFELADQGTILLDEIGDMPPDLQVKLLRVLQEQEIERVGGKQPIRINVRVLCATAKDLGEAVKNGQFREDLYYRLQVIPITVPPLRQRKEDIAELATYYLKKFGAERGLSFSLSEEAAQALGAYAYPGNVRELRNLMERLTVLAPSSQIQLWHLPAELRGTAPAEDDSQELNLAAAVANAEKRCILRALKKTDGNKTEAADLLGISRKNLWEKMKLYGL